MQKKSFLMLLFFLLILKTISFAGLKIDADTLFNYDKNSLLPKLKLIKKLNGGEEYSLQYRSVLRQKVSALYFIPSGTKDEKFPAVIFLHGLHSEKEAIFEAIPFFFKEKFAVLAIDAQYHGERKVAGYDLISANMYESRFAMLQTIFDLRKAVDFLQSRPEIIKDKIGYLGESMGSILGVTFVAIDTRIKTAVFLVGGGNFRILMKNIPFAGVLFNEKIYKDLEFLDPVNYVDRISPRPVLFINAKNDEVVSKASTEALFNKCKNPKKIIWVDAGHGIAGEIKFPLVVDWFKEKFKK